jgi:hypothetical protein
MPDTHCGVVSNPFVAKIALWAAFAFLPIAAAYGTAYTIDLSTPGTSATINGALFNYDNISSGSGSYTDMFRVHASGTEQGYNYDGTSAVPFDQVGGVGIPHQPITAIPIVTINGTQYMRLNFDANNSGGLVLTDFRMYVNNSGSSVFVNSTSNLSNLGTLVYDFNAGAGGPNTLTMTAFPSGSGTDNMSINIPLSVVLGQGFNFNTANVYFFASFANTDGGFEEFAIDKSQPVNIGSLMPEAQPVWGGGAMAVLGLGGMVIARRRRRAADAKAETALS